MQVSRHRFEKDLIKLNMNLSEMGRLCMDSLENIKDFIRDISSYNNSASDRIVENYSEIKELGDRVESRAIKLIMRESPVATDLRVITSALKIVVNFETIGRHAVNIVDAREDVQRTKNYDSLDEMAARAYDITASAVNAYMNNDLDLVEEVYDTDDLIDQAYKDITDEVVEDIKSDTILAEEAVSVLVQAKYFERIGDQAEDVAHWVRYTVTGERS